MNLYTNGDATYITITAGETVALAMQIADASNTPINLTGYTLKCQVNFPAPLSLTTANGGIAITNASQGQAQINISDAASAALPPGAYPFDVWMISGGGVATPLLAGNFTVTPNVALIP